MKVGLISDTHSLLRPEALEAMRGCDRIVHAGDIGDASILESLARIAPVTPVRGNNDRAAWADAVAQSEMLRIEDAWIYVIHDLAELDIDPAAAGVDAVVAGHTHQPAARSEKGILYVNPGSAGPRRFKLPVSVGYLHVDGASVRAELRTLG